MKNFKLSRRILPLLAAGITLVSLSGCNKKTESIKKENLVGYIDEQPDKVDQEDFIIYNVGNHSRTVIKKQDKTLKKCEKLGISTGIIIESDAKDKIDIYEDVEFVKGIIEQNNIDFPVYLNPKNIIDNKELSKGEKADFIGEFLYLIEQNNIYVGLYGTSTDLKYINENLLPIEQYDSFVVEDGKDEYTGKSSLIKDKRDNIESTYKSKEYNDNLAEMIRKNNLNEKEALKQTAYHKVQKDETLRYIADLHNLSESDLLKFNELEEKDIKTGIILRIPNELQNEKKLIMPKLQRQERAVYRGIDISHHQGDPKNINFSALSKKIDFAILKIAEQETKNYNELNKDEYFDEYYEYCRENGILIGGYYVTHATTVEEAVNEAKLIVNKIKDLKLNLPVFIDYENTINTMYEKEFNKIINNKQFEIILEAVNDIFVSEGIRFGIYANLSTYDQMVNAVGLKKLEQYELWLSCLKQYKFENQVLDNGPRCRTENGTFDYPCDINQVSESITDLGIGNKEGHVDYNLCYKKYDAQIQVIDVEPTEIFETKKYKRNNTNVNIIIIKYIGIPTISLLGLYTYGHKRKIKKYVRTIANKIL